MNRASLLIDKSRVNQLGRIRCADKSGQTHHRITFRESLKDSANPTEPLQDSPWPRASSRASPNSADSAKAPLALVKLLGSESAPAEAEMMVWEEHPYYQRASAKTPSG